MNKVEISSFLSSIFLFFSMHCSIGALTISIYSLAYLQHVWIFFCIIYTNVCQLDIKILINRVQCTAYAVNKKRNQFHFKPLSLLSNSHSETKLYLKSFLSSTITSFPTNDLKNE